MSFDVVKLNKADKFVYCRGAFKEIFAYGIVLLVILDVVETVVVEIDKKNVTMNTDIIYNFRTSNHRYHSLT